MSAYAKLITFALGIQGIFNNLPKTVNGIYDKRRKRRHYQHKVEKRMRNTAKGIYHV